MTLTVAELEKKALSYLERYDASVAQLRGVLVRYIRRKALAEAQPELCAELDALLARYQASRLLDDARFADSLVRGLRERGASLHLLRKKLGQRGLPAAVIEEALRRSSEVEGSSAGAHGESAELAAARIYVRRRRLKTRYDLAEPAGRQKALAALGRQGFSYAVASRALAEDES